MFTGLVTDVGRIRSIVRTGYYRIQIETSYPTVEIPIDAETAQHVLLKQRAHFWLRCVVFRVRTTFFDNVKLRR